MVASRPLRILHVIASLNPEAGGVLEWVRQFSQVAVSQGHQVLVLTMDDPTEPFLADFPLPYVAVGSQAKGFWSSGMLAFLKREAANHDVVVAHGLWRFASFGTWLGMRGQNTPYYLYTHGMLDPWFNKAYPAKTLFKRLYYPFAEYPALRDAKAVIFTCEEERRLAATSFRPYRVNPAVLPLGISAPPEDEDTHLAAFYSRYPDLKDKRLLLFLSRIHPKKGCDLLLSAFAKLAQEYQDLHLVMAGPDQTGWVERLQTQARELGIAGRITWTGMITGDVKWGAFRAAEAFILPSHQENFGFVVVEALACGTPALVSDKVNIYDEVVRGQAGLSAPDTENGTLQLLAGWLSLPASQRQAMAQNARACFKNTFEVTQATTNVIQLFGNGINTADPA